MKREIHYWIFQFPTQSAKVIINDQEQEKKYLQFLANYTLEHNVYMNDKNQFYLQRYEDGKRVKQFSWGKPQQERLFQ